MLKTQESLQTLSTIDTAENSLNKGISILTNEKQKWSVLMQQLLNSVLLINGSVWS